MNTPMQLNPPAIGIIIIGDEILSGKRSDKHLPKFIELLNERGLQLAWAEYVGDSPERITQVLARAFASGDVVFSCGGIGATPDDHTRQCAAQAIGVPLALHPEAKALILERMRDVATEQGVAFEPNRDDNLHRLNMGTFPKALKSFSTRTTKFLVSLVRRTTRHGSLCARFSCHGMAYDARQTRCLLSNMGFSAQAHREVCDCFWRHGGNPDPLDGAH
jgi:hypothetical protein